MMPKLGSHHQKRGLYGLSCKPRVLATEALEALARYNYSLGQPGEHEHEKIALRLEEVIKTDRWEEA